MASFVADMCVRLRMTRDQVLDESLCWLLELDKAEARHHARNVMAGIDAVLAGVAPGALKNGDKITKKIRKAYERIIEQ